MWENKSDKKSKSKIFRVKEKGSNKWRINGKEKKNWKKERYE